MLVMQVLRGFLPGTSYWFSRRFFAGRQKFFAGTVLLFGVATFGQGCGLAPSAGATGALSIPPAGSVRIVAREIENTGRTLHYKWSVIGERNWVEAQAAVTGQPVVLSLGKTYTLNNPTVRGGCNIWEADLTLTTRGTQGLWAVRLHGSDGTTATAHGSENLNGRPLNQVLHVDQERDMVTSLPADLLLAHLGDREVRFTLAK